MVQVYRYYWCRHAYDKNSGGDCPARYLRCDRLEGAVWCEVKRVLTNPELVLHELRRLAEEEVDELEVSRLKAVLADLQEREKRLVHLYTLGEFKEETLRTESAIIAGQRQVLEGQLSSMKRSAPPLADDLDQEGLNLVSTAVARWLDQADESGKALVLEALQIRVLATVDEAKISGVLPTQLPEAIGDEPASDYLDFREQPGLPFDRASLASKK